MKKLTTSFLISFLGLLVLAGCNSANQNTYRATTAVDAKQAEIERLCKLKYYAAASVPGAGPGQAAGAYADCLLKYSKVIN